jgi:hypothetical protein
MRLREPLLDVLDLLQTWPTRPRCVPGEVSVIAYVKGLRMRGARQ